MYLFLIFLLVSLVVCLTVYFSVLIPVFVSVRMILKIPIFMLYTSGKILDAPWKLPSPLKIEETLVASFCLTQIR